MNMKFVSDKVHVIEKEINEYVRDDGKSVNYYNLNVGGFGWGLNVSVKEELFNKVEEGKEYNFVGHLGRTSKGTYWSLDDLYTK